MGYCEEDVVTTEKLFLSQLDKLTKKDNNFNRIISQACFHGKAMGYCAQVEANGIHIDHKLFKDFRANFEKIKKLEIEEINKLCNYSLIFLYFIYYANKLITNRYHIFRHYQNLNKQLIYQYFYFFINFKK